MIITCPHCQTKYQVTYEAIGAVGRKVQCAHCQKAWQQAPLETTAQPPSPPPVIDAMAEDALDEAMAEEERAVAAEKPATPKDEQSAKVDAALLRRREKAFSRRQNARAAHFPLARVRRVVRWTSFLLLIASVALLYFARVEVVTRLPAMAGLYERLGLPVNVVGLDFAGIKTLRSLQNGKDVLVVSAQIVGLMPEPMPVPPVVITLIDDQGHGIYEWSVAPAVRNLAAGDRSTFDTQLAAPPLEAHRVRLSFAGHDAAPAAPSPTTFAPPAEDHASPPAAHEETSAVAAHDATPAEAGHDATPAPQPHSPSQEHH